MYVHESTSAHRSQRSPPPRHPRTEIIGSCEPLNRNAGNQALVLCKNSTGAFSHSAISPACIHSFPIGFLPFIHCHPHPPPLHHGRTFSLGSSVAAEFMGVCLKQRKLAPFLPGCFIFSWNTVLPNLPNMSNSLSSFSVSAMFWFPLCHNLHNLVAFFFLSPP